MQSKRNVKLIFNELKLACHFLRFDKNTHITRFNLNYAVVKSKRD